MTPIECLEAAHEWMLDWQESHGISNDDLKWAKIMAVLAMARMDLKK